MIDRYGRDRFAEALRHFAAGIVTNNDYESLSEDFLESGRLKRDDALFAIWSRMWLYYDDLSAHKMTGDYQLSREDRREIARWFLFLRSDRDYEWPIRDFTSMTGFFGVLSLGITNLIEGERKKRKIKAMKNWNLWPFIRREDYETALSRPFLLCGRVESDTL